MYSYIYIYIYIYESARQHTLGGYRGIYVGMYVCKYVQVDSLLAKAIVYRPTASSRWSPWPHHLLKVVGIT
jgi:hypothetical protein